MSAPRPLVCYDARCRLCRFAAHVLVASDGTRALGVAPADSGRAALLLARLEPAERAASLHVVAPDGSIASAQDALVAIAGALRGTRALGRALARSARARRVLAGGYRLVACHRGRLSRLVPERSPVSV